MDEVFMPMLGLASRYTPAIRRSCAFREFSGTFLLVLDSPSFDAFVSGVVLVDGERSEVEVGCRLHGARLAAGWVDVGAAAGHLGFPTSTLMSWEDGSEDPSDEHMASVAVGYKVSIEYLDGEGATSPVERLADRLAAILSSADGRLKELASDWSDRLAIIRDRHPFESIDEAAYSCGTLVTTILKHEFQELPPSIDFQIGYALALRARPEFAVLTTLPLHPKESEHVDWWDPLPPSASRVMGKEWMVRFVSLIEERGVSKP